MVIIGFELNPLINSEVEIRVVTILKDKYSDFIKYNFMNMLRKRRCCNGRYNNQARTIVRF